MKIQETVLVRGYLQMRVYQCGRLIEDYQNHNLIVDGAHEIMAKLIVATFTGLPATDTGKKIDRIAFGINGTDPTPGDTVITSPFIKGFDHITFPAPNQVSFNWSLGTTEANGKAISEFGLLCTDGTLFARRNRVKPINKDSDIAIEGQWVIVFGQSYF
jgi:hypothetical protein